MLADPVLADPGATKNPLSPEGDEGAARPRLAAMTRYPITRRCCRMPATIRPAARRCQTPPVNSAGRSSHHLGRRGGACDDGRHGEGRPGGVPTADGGTADSGGAGHLRDSVGHRRRRLDLVVRAAGAGTDLRNAHLDRRRSGRHPHRAGSPDRTGWPGPRWTAWSSPVPAGRSPSAHDGRRLRLPMVRPRDLPRLAAVSGGSLRFDLPADASAEAAQESAPGPDRPADPADRGYAGLTAGAAITGTRWIPAGATSRVAWIPTQQACSPASNAGARHAAASFSHLHPRTQHGRGPRPLACDRDDRW